MNVKQNGKSVGKVRGGGAGAFDKLQKSRPVINQAGIRPGIQDPEHLLGLRGSRAGEKGSPSPAWGRAGGTGPWPAQPPMDAEPSDARVHAEPD